MVLPWKMSLAGGREEGGRAEDAGLQRDYESTDPRNKKVGERRGRSRWRCVDFRGTKKHGEVGTNKERR